MTPVQEASQLKIESRAVAPGVWFRCAGAAFLFFLLLAWLVTHGKTLPWDMGIRDAIHSFATPTLTRWMDRITRVGSYTLLRPAILACLVVLPFLGRARQALLMAAAALGGILLEINLKHVFHRHRPDPFFGTAPPDFSFPSGHAIFAICFYGVIAFLLFEAFESRTARVVLLSGATLVILLIGISRIYLGVHYPSDVLGGFAIGSVWTCLSLAVYQRFGGGGPLRRK